VITISSAGRCPVSLFEHELGTILPLRTQRASAFIRPSPDTIPHLTIWATALMIPEPQMPCAWPAYSAIADLACPGIDSDIGNGSVAAIMPHLI